MHTYSLLPGPMVEFSESPQPRFKLITVCLGAQLKKLCCCLLWRVQYTVAVAASHRFLYRSIIPFLDSHTSTSAVSKIPDESTPFASVGGRAAVYFGRFSSDARYCGGSSLPRNLTSWWPILQQPHSSEAKLCRDIFIMVRYLDLEAELLHALHSGC
ncbi:hypothetical protein BDW74DRAFT_145708 [Aspergillus multicolor]|uniref:uncharacterized protein n=1 Tax=Aspergillus multicolor TaxID=41759 RepID=UPI003CCD7C68